MKSLYNKVNVVISILFVLGILFSAYSLYNLPANLEKISGRVDYTIVKEIGPALSQLNIIVGLTLFLGLGSIILALYLLNYNRVKDEISYAGNASTQIQEEEGGKELAEEEDLDNQVKSIQSGISKLKDSKVKYEHILSKLCMKIDASQGILYSFHKEKNKKFIQLFASFAYNLPESETVKYEFGEGLAGQVAKEGKKINIKDIPDGYITIISGLGASSPSHLAILPIKEKDEVVFVVEIASFHTISESEEKLIARSLIFEDVKAKTSEQKIAESKEVAEKWKKLSDL